jgi:hypothetical protein
MDTIIIFNLSHYTNITITITFVKQVMLCRAFSFDSPENYPDKTGAIFHIDLYVFIIPGGNFKRHPQALPCDAAGRLSEQTFPNPIQQSESSLP